MKLTHVVTIGKNVQVQSISQQLSEEVFAADDLAEALDIIEAHEPELIVFDRQLSPAKLAKFLIAAGENLSSKIAVIGDDDDGFDSEKIISAGAHYCLKISQAQEQLPKIANQIKNDNCGNNDFFVNGLAEAVGIVGKSKAIEQMLKMIKIVASSQCNPILIIGETGTGKELTARALHQQRNQGKPFIAVNCAALTANLLESELFGHVKGAFTSADREKTGLLEMAAEGTIFLDEISEMPLDMQAKLLRLLQEKTLRKVGGVKEIKCKATIIASSNRNLKKEANENRFRSDLYHRLNIFPIKLSPLRNADRCADIGLMAEYFLKTSTIHPEKSRGIKAITKLAVECLKRYEWRGNSRELKNIIDKAILLETTDKIGTSSIVIDDDDCDCCSSSENNEQIKNFSLEKAEQQLIAKALAETNWQKTRAAELLGISRATLYAKVKQHNIEAVLNGCEDAGEVMAVA